MTSSSRAGTLNSGPAQISHNHLSPLVQARQTFSFTGRHFPLLESVILSSAACQSPVRVVSRASAKMIQGAFPFHLEVGVVCPSCGTMEDLSPGMYWPRDAIFPGFDSLLCAVRPMWHLITKIWIILLLSLAFSNRAPLWSPCWSQSASAT